VGTAFGRDRHRSPMALTMTPPTVASVGPRNEPDVVK
jgi:hypothetical protein